MSTSSTPFRVVVMASTDASDLFFANQLARRFPLAGIVLEHQRTAPDRRPRLNKALSLAHRPKELLARSIQLLDRTCYRHVLRRMIDEEPADFGHDGRQLHAPQSCPVLKLEGSDRLNSNHCLDWLRRLSPDVIAVCGTSLLKHALLQVPTRGTLNLHGGLSQFYRGLFTTDWAIHNGEPEKVGATVHFVNAGIDTGKVVFQGKAQLTLSDHPNKAYEKVVRLGVEMMTAAIVAIEQNALPTPIEPSAGKLYLARDFTNLTRFRLWRRWRSVMAEYEQSRESRDSAIVENLINPYGDTQRSIAVTT